MDLSSVGRVLLIAGAVIAVLGLILILAGRGLLPRLPGDIAIQRESFRLYLPLGTSILVSIVLTVVLNLLLRR